MAQVEVLLEGLDHPECVAWGLDGSLYAGGEAGQIYRIDVVQRSTQLVGNTGGFVLGIALDASGNVFACDSQRRAVIRMSADGTTSVITDGSVERSMVTPNYPVFTRSGRLFVSDSGTWEENDGCIYVREPDGATHVWSTEARQFPNGLALDQGEKFLYVVESTGERVVRIPFNSDGSAGRMELVVDLTRTVPDGLAFDVIGGLLISCYRPDVIYYLSSNETLTVLAEDYRGTILAAPTNVCFGGESMKRLFVANLGRWHISEIPMTVAGNALNYPVLN
jgi:gluconolactonase